MSSVTARLSIIGETTSCEPDQDANSALTELDKGKFIFLNLRLLFIFVEHLAKCNSFSCNSYFFKNYQWYDYIKIRNKKKNHDIVLMKFNKIIVSFLQTTEN